MYHPRHVEEIKIQGKDERNGRTFGEIEREYSRDDHRNYRLITKVGDDYSVH